MIITSQNNEPTNLELTGGKAKSLLALQKLGFTVPDFVVIPPDTEITNVLLSAVKKYFSKNTAARFAVRSSAVDEDSATHSFAGQFETFLNVPFNKLEEKIKLVQASADSERVKIYRQKNNLQEKQPVAVIIQEMVDADISGVAFGANPVTGNTNEKIISAVPGLGEDLVSGKLSAETVTAGSKGEILKIEGKEEPSVLKEKHIYEIIKALKKAEQHFKSPQDIEFSFKNHRLYLLQSRPITTLKAEDYIIWDNSNIVESYPGITTPLTFSFIIKIYGAVYQQFCLLMGVPQQTINKNDTVFACMLGLIKGRVYYNLLSWYKVLALLPGYTVNAQFMENMMGVKERFTLRQHNKMRKSKAWFYIFKTIGKMLYHFFALPNERKKFQAYIQKKIKEYENKDFQVYNPEQLMNAYLDFEKIMLKKWRAPLINDFFAMIFFGVLQKLVKKYFPQHPHLHNDLLCGSKDIVSTLPVQKLIEITHLIAAENQKEFFRENRPEAVWNELQKQNQLKPIKAKINEYITDFGDRSVGELKLETITYKQNPALLIKVLQSYLMQKPAAFKGNNENKIRQKAQQIIHKKLKHQPLRKFIFKKVLKTTRTLVSQRENMRYERTKAFGIVRAIFTEFGKKFHAHQLIECPQDIFYLTRDEIFNYISGTAVSADLKGIIKARKEEFLQYKNAPPPPDRIKTQGLPYSCDFAADKKHGNAALKGIGCCAGEVTGAVTIVDDPQTIQSLDGNILAARSTDPGWITLFPTASAILVERGSLLSHSAIVSREMGIPCIVGVEGLLATLKTGDKIAMNGSTGEIKLL